MGWLSRSVSCQFQEVSINLFDDATGLHRFDVLFAQVALVASRGG